MRRRLEARKAAVAIEKQQQTLLEDPKTKITVGAEKTDVKFESKQNNNENIPNPNVVAINNAHVSPKFEPEDSGYKSSNGRPGSQVEPIETDVLL